MTPSAGYTQREAACRAQKRKIISGLVTLGPARRRRRVSVLVVGRRGLRVLQARRRGDGAARRSGSTSTCRCTASSCPDRSRSASTRSTSRSSTSSARSTAAASIDVRYAGTVPDTFKDRAEVVVKGTLGDGKFEAREISAKCPSKYAGEGRRSARPRCAPRGDKNVGDRADAAQQLAMTAQRDRLARRRRPPAGAGRVAPTSSAPPSPARGARTSAWCARRSTPPTPPPALIAFASAVMWFAILSNDYSIKYVQRHSDASMPWFYKLTSFWGGLDGSIMWWVLLLALFSSLAIYVNRERHRELIPYVTAILYVVIGFFLFLIIFEKRPFDIFLTEAPRIGKGHEPAAAEPVHGDASAVAVPRASSRRRCRSPSAWRRSSPATSTTRGCSRRAAGCSSAGTSCRRA